MSLGGGGCPLVVEVSAGGGCTSARPHVACPSARYITTRSTVTMNDLHTPCLLGGTISLGVNLPRSTHTLDSYLGECKTALLLSIIFHKSPQAQPTVVPTSTIMTLPT